LIEIAGHGRIRRQQKANKMDPVNEMRTTGFKAEQIWRLCRCGISVARWSWRIAHQESKIGRVPENRVESDLSLTVLPTSKTGIARGFLTTARLSRVVCTSQRSFIRARNPYKNPTRTGVDVNAALGRRRCNGDDAQSRNLHKKLAQVFLRKFLASNFRASSCKFG